MKLTKREAILLAILTVAILIFVEYQFLYTPQKMQYDTLVAKNETLQKQVADTHKKIASITQIRLNKEKVISQVDAISAPFFGKLNTDALLWNTHSLLMSSGMQYKSYKLEDNKLISIENKQTTISSYVYQLQKLANDYSNIAQTIDKPATPTPAPTPAANAGKSDKSSEIETCSFTIDMTGTYEQLRQFVASLESLNKTISVSTLNIKSSGVKGIIDATVEVNFFGVAKFKDVADQANTWSQQAYLPGSGDPYMKEVVVMPTPAVTTTKR